mmetsp:Transcript_50405/g.93920  ORF Transcript_50405/g.93920 Transcript_50405/m.93920 type:complete len:301 (+) Transcript_50405:363-1265(+)
MSAYDEAYGTGERRSRRRTCSSSEQGLHGDEREAASPPSLSLSDRTLERLGFGAPQVWLQFARVAASQLCEVLSDTSSTWVEASPTQQGLHSNRMDCAAGTGEESVGGLEHIACFCRELLRVEELDQSRGKREGDALLDMLLRCAAIQLFETSEAGCSNSTSTLQSLHPTLFELAASATSSDRFLCHASGPGVYAAWVLCGRQKFLQHLSTVTGALLQISTAEWVGFSKDATTEISQNSICPTQTIQRDWQHFKRTCAKSPILWQQANHHLAYWLLASGQHQRIQYILDELNKKAPVCGI